MLVNLRKRKHGFSPNLYGALLVFASGVLAALSNGLVHGLSVKLSVFQLVFLKTLVAFLVLLIVYFRRVKEIMKTNIIRFHILKSLFGALGNFFWFGALLYLPLAQSASLSLTSALFTSIGGWILFQEKFKKLVLTSLIIGFVGVLTVLNPFNETIEHVYFLLLPLFSALFFSGSSLIIKTISKSDGSLTTLFYLMLFMCLFSAPLALWYWQWPQFSDLLRVFLVGLFYIATQIALIEAYTKAEASFIAPFKFARFPLNIFSGFIFFFEVPVISTLVGGGLIIFSNVLLIKLEKRKVKSVR
ncbi:MAG: hypothetical protein CMM87_00660 [Rickettsiales bacterium]|nr:hypothetical protein [Rickettsiales bacterium]|tara:strand:+ start:56338 stop:57240 length:903 start_codon:yes stop_codon:yes gene_type:complete